MESRRIDYLDAAKGVAMLLIIVGHVGLVYRADAIQGGMPYDIVRFAFTVHLPLFFIVSGYFLHDDRPFSAAYVKSCAKALLLPYLASCLIITSANTLLALATPGVSTVDTLRNWVLASIWGAGDVHPFSPFQVWRIGGIWFLWALFWARILFSLVSRLNDGVKLLLSLAAWALSMIIGSFTWLPLSLLSGLGCCLFIEIGVLFRKVRLFDRVHGKWLVVAAAVWLFVIRFGGMSSAAMSVYPLGIIDVLGGAAGSLCVVALCKAMQERKMLGFSTLARIGHYSLAIFTFHIIEDDVISWGTWGAMLTATTNGVAYDWIILLLSRFLVISFIVWIASKVPALKGIYRLEGCFDTFEKNTSIPLAANGKSSVKNGSR